MSRLFDNISENKRSLERIETKSDEIIRFKNTIHDVLYGNGKEGLITKVSRVFHTQLLQWALFITLLWAVFHLVTKR